MTKVMTPDPVAYCGQELKPVYANHLDVLKRRDPTLIPFYDTTLYDHTRLEAYANSRVTKALEEAANKVADPVNIEATIKNFGWVGHGNYVRAHLILLDAVEAILALISEDPPCET